MSKKAYKLLNQNSSDTEDDHVSFTMESTDKIQVREKLPKQLYHFIKSNWVQISLIILAVVVLLGLQIATFTEQQQLKEELKVLWLENSKLRETMTSQDRQHETEIKELRETTTTIGKHLSLQQQEIKMVATLVEEVRQLTTSQVSNVSSLLGAHVDLGNRVDMSFNELFSRLNRTQLPINETMSSYEEDIMAPSQLLKQIETLKEQVSSMNDSISLVHVRLDSMKRKTQINISRVPVKFQSSINQLQKEQASFESRLNTLEGLSNRLHQDLPELPRKTNTSISQLEKEQTIIRSRLDSLENHTKTLDSHAMTLNSHAMTLDSHTKTLDSHTKTLDSHTWTLDSHTRTLDSHTKKLDSHTKTLDSHTKTLDSHTRTLDSHTKKLDSHTKTLDSHTKKLDSHTKTLDSHTKKLDSHTWTLDSHTKKLDSHTWTLDSHGKTLDSHTNRLNSHANTLDAHDTEINDLQEKVENLKTGEIVLGVILAIPILALFILCCVWCYKHCDEYC